MIESILAPADAGRLAATLAKLRSAGLTGAAVTGGIAIASKLARTAAHPGLRRLNDLDLVVADAGAIPASLATAFLLSHVHLDALPGRMLVQVIDPNTALRVDIFREFVGQLTRSTPVLFRGHDAIVVASGDLVARLTALLLDLEYGEPVQAKHARDLSVLMEHADAMAARAAWPNHRRARHPASFDEAHCKVAELIRSRADLLVEPCYSAALPCPKCRDFGVLRVAPPEAIVNVLGYR